MANVTLGGRTLATRDCLFVHFGELLPGKKFVVRILDTPEDITFNNLFIKKLCERSPVPSDSIIKMTYDYRYFSKLIQIL